MLGIIDWFKNLVKCEHEINFETGECTKCGKTYDWFTDDCENFTNFDNPRTTIDDPKKISGTLLIKNVTSIDDSAF